MTHLSSTVCTIGIRCTILLKRSTTTSKKSYHRIVFGRGPTKSMVTSTQRSSGCGEGCKNPIGLRFDAFVLWQVTQVVTYFWTSDVSPGQYTWSCTYCKVLFRPMCPDNTESWHSCMIFVLSSMLIGIHSFHSSFILLHRWCPSHRMFAGRSSSLILITFWHSSSFTYPVRTLSSELEDPKIEICSTPVDGRLQASATTLCRPGLYLMSNLYSCSVSNHRAHLFENFGCV